MSFSSQTISGSDAMLHIEQIRSQKFSIGKEESNPLTQDLHQAVTSLSAELYTKDVHFLMELIQNAEDNEYEESVEPSLEFVLTKRDITGIGSPATLLIFNNEIGFSKKNMDSLCSVGRSTKKGKRKLGFIGEKGIGFKSVFLVSAKPHIYSNEYRIRFCEEPDPKCGIGYIVPEWITEKPRLADIHAVYGLEKTLPTTVFVLPLKPEKVEAVKSQLSAMHPEILLFLSKIKRLSVCVEDLDSPEKNSVSIVSVSSESNHARLRDLAADSRIVQLSVRERGCEAEETCKYFMWRQEFPVRVESRVGSRADANQWAVSLAFPFGKRLTRGSSSVGVFAFLPTAMVTNFPFVIQADFILASSREFILMDNPWNLGILECVPRAFVNAFQACVKGESWFSSIGQIFEFLPVQESSHSGMNVVRESIRSLLLERRIVPYDLFDGKRRLATPGDVIRILPQFHDILSRIKTSGGVLDGMRNLKKVLHASLELEKYHRVLGFLGVKENIDWYAQCMVCCNLVAQASPEVYMELLSFVSNFRMFSNSENFRNIPFLRYTNKEGHMRLCKVSQVKKGEITLKYASDQELHVWLGKCNMELGFPKNVFFLPDDTQKFLMSHERSASICSWLSSCAMVSSISAINYASNLCPVLPPKRTDLIVRLARFLYLSHEKHFINSNELYDLCARIPVIDRSGHVVKERAVTLVPASASKWAKLFGLVNPYSKWHYVDIGDFYSKAGSFLGESVPNKAVLDFICKYSNAKDIPQIQPPSVELQIASSRLSMEQAFLLLDWIRFLRTGGSHIPEKFKASIQDGKWMKTSKGYCSPKQSILPDIFGTVVYDMVKHILENISVIDQNYYGGRINNYQDELRFLGVGFGSDDVQRLVMTTFTSLSASGIRKDQAFSLLMFIGFLKQKNEVNEDWLRGMKKRKWMKTHRGYVSPEECVFLYSSTVDSDSFSRITGHCVVDEAFYGAKLGAFLPELALLGVKTDLRSLYKLVAEKANFGPNHLPVTCAYGITVMRCISYLGPTEASGLIQRIKGQQWLKTTSGFRSPSESIIPDSAWVSLARALEIPVVDEVYYRDETRLLREALRAVGVSVDVDSVVSMIANKFKSLLIHSELAPENALLVLGGFRELRQTLAPSYSELQWLFTEKWLKTRHGYKAPNDSILFSLKWGAISSFVDLPLIDDAFYGIAIYKFKDELKTLGVITDFEEGSELVLRGFKGPIDLELVAANGTVALLDCMKSAMSKSSLEQSVLDSFLHGIAKSKFLKTSHGYLGPDKCVLFDKAWKRILRRTDVPSIEEVYYRADLSLYEDQLRAIGVKIDPLDVCTCISRILYAQCDTSVINRLYKFMSKYDWKPEVIDEENAQVWISDQGSDTGRWVRSKFCVVHDTDSLFYSRLYSLESYYAPGLLPLFSSAFDVRKFPSLEKYLQLWNDWGSCADREVSHSDCLSVWQGILMNLTLDTEQTLSQNLTKVPAISCVGDRIRLVNKENAFIPDDLRLKKSFSTSSVPLFVWFPKHGTSPASMSRRLLEIYGSLGVKKASESVVCTVSADPSENPVQGDGLIGKGLIKIALAFLSGPRLEMPERERRERAASLFEASVYESRQPIRVTYALTPTMSGEKVEVETEKMIFWDKSSGNIVIDESGYSGRKNSIEFASCFAEEIAEGLVPKGRDLAADSLSRIIHIGFVYEFDEEAVEFLLVRENLELCSEDEKFLSNAFSRPTQPGGKLTRGITEATPSTPSKSCKKRKLKSLSYV